MSEAGISVSRWLYSALGVSFLIIGAVGVFMPILPTTPFVLLASACFIRGNPKLHQRLIEHPTFGPILTNWQQHRAIEAKIKRKAYLFIVASFAFSIYFAPLIWVKVALCIVFFILIVWFRSIPTHVNIADTPENH